MTSSSAVVACVLRVMAALIALGALATVGACAIAADDPFPNFGAHCTVSEGHCDIEHVCLPDAPGKDTGTCAPIVTFGAACDDKEAVSHPPGRAGKDDELDTLEINGVEDLGAIQDVRSVTGQVRTFEPGVDNVDIPDFCDFRALQRVGDGFGVGDTENVVTLDGLQSVTSVSQGLAIVDNDQLEDIGGLANLADLTARTSENTTFDVVIAANPKLDDDDVDAFLADLSKRVGRDLDVVACNNHGRSCSPAEVVLLNALVSQGFH